MITDVSGYNKSMNLNVKTKQFIVDELKTRQTILWGKGNEADFVGKLVNMSQLPSNDQRFDDMNGDYWQHRENNLDWEDSWLLSDERVNLLGDDNLFLKFICELLHPSVREADEATELKLMINYYLKKDGMQIVEDEEYYEPGLSTYKVAEINPSQIEKSFKTTDEFVHEAYEKIDKRIQEEDYSGAITSARTLLEDSLEDIYYQITSDNINAGDDLQTAYKKVQQLLKLDYDYRANDAKTQLLRSFVTITNSLAALSNSSGDRHATKQVVKRHTALLCTDTTKIFVNYLYGRLQELHGIHPSIYSRILKVIDSEARFSSREELLKIDTISSALTYCDGYLSSILIKKLINEYGIHSFRQSDVFLAFLRIFTLEIREVDLFRIIEKHINNNQTAGFDTFLKNLYEERNELFSERVLKLIEEARYIEVNFEE